MTIEHIIGIDLGDGESCAFHKRVGEPAAPAHLELMGRRKSIPTAIGVTKDGHATIGEEAIRRYNQLDQLEINFKRRPIADGSFSRAASLFMLQMIGSCRAEHIVPLDQAAIYVGCPSFWTTKERESYQDSLSTATDTPVTVLKESRAALYWWLSREHHKVPWWSLKKLRVLIIDIGSSTTDFTYIQDATSDSSFDGGLSLGGRDLDELLLEHFVSTSPDRVHLEKYLQHPPTRARLLYACRRNKEEYFSNEEMYCRRIPGHAELEADADHVDVQGSGLNFTPYITASLMATILSAPIRRLKNQSWPEAFRDSVASVKQGLPESPMQVVLTGGASRMAFARQLVCDCFGFNKERVLCDNEPQYSIGAGLTLAGDLDIRRQRFEVEIEIFASTILSAKLDANKSLLINRLSTYYVTAYLDNCLAPCLREYREGKINAGAAITERATRRLEAWLETPSCSEGLDQVRRAWLIEIKPELEEEPVRICRSYNLPDGALSIPTGSLEPTSLAISGVTFNSGGFIFGGAAAGVLIAAFIALPLALITGPLFSWLGAELARTTMTDEKIKRLCSDSKPRVRDQISLSLNASSEVEDMISRVADSVRQAFMQRASKAKRLLSL